MRMRPQDAVRRFLNAAVLYGLAYSLVRYSTDLSHFERSIELLNAMSELGGDLPRERFRRLGWTAGLAKRNAPTCLQH